MLLHRDDLRDLERFARELWTGGAGEPRRIPMDAYRRGDRVWMHFDMPGVDPDSIEVACGRDALTVRASRTYPSREGDDILCQERYQGAFVRDVSVSEALDLDHAEARYENGVLTVAIPVTKSAEPHKIAVKKVGTPIDVAAF